MNGATRRALIAKGEAKLQDTQTAEAMKPEEAFDILKEKIKPKTHKYGIKRLWSDYRSQNPAVRTGTPAWLEFLPKISKTGRYDMLRDICCGTHDLDSAIVAFARWVIENKKEPAPPEETHQISTDRYRTLIAAEWVLSIEPFTRSNGDEMRSMLVRYNGTCSKCGKRLSRGDAALHKSGNGYLVCVECAGDIVRDRVVSASVSDINRGMVTMEPPSSARARQIADELARLQIELTALGANRSNP